MPLSKLLVKTLVLVLLISFFLLFPQTNVVYLFICYLSKSFSEPLWYKYEDSSKFKDLFIHGRFGECLEPTFLYAWGEVTTLKVFARGKKKKSFHVLLEIWIFISKLMQAGCFWRPRGGYTGSAKSVFGFA